MVWSVVVDSEGRQMAIDDKGHGHAREPEEEVKKTANGMVVEAGRQPSVANVVNINRYGGLEKLLRVTAWVFRFIANSRLNQDETARSKRSGRLSKEELVEAERKWLKTTQADLQRQGNFQHLKNDLGLVES